jgi:hypothetical protein
MMKNLDAICEDMRDEIDEHFALGHGDAVELFKEIWNKMTAGPNAKDLADAIEKVAEAFTI